MSQSTAAKTCEQMMELGWQLVVRICVKVERGGIGCRGGVLFTSYPVKIKHQRAIVPAVNTWHLLINLSEP